MWPLFLQRAHHVVGEGPSYGSSLELGLLGPAQSFTFTYGLSIGAEED